MPYPADENDSVQLKRTLVQYLQSLRGAGVTQLPSPLEVGVPNVATTGENISHSHAATTTDRERIPDMPARGKPTAARSTRAPQSPPLGADKRSEPELSPEKKVAQLQILQKEVAGCTLCAELATSRTQTVFGVGNPSTKVCFIGGGTRCDEDRKGEPFVGRAGQLLTDIIEKGMGLQREDVYILNVLKCRPPGNRNPLPDEVCNCRGFFERQLESSVRSFSVV